MTLKRTFIGLLLLAVVLSIAQIAPAALRAQDGTTSCSVSFKANVRSGPSSGTTLDGQLNISIDASGVITGNVVQEGKDDIPVVGQVTGRAINMALDLSTAENPALFVFGVGTSLDPIQSDSCGTALGGPFVGPGDSDSGDWLAGYGIGG